MTTFSFGPSGSWSPFNAGVAMYLLENVPFDRERATVYVISGGALGLALLLYDDPQLLYERVRGACQIMAQLKKLGPLAPFSVPRICRQGLDYLLPEDAHLRLGDRVFVGLTHVRTRKAVVRQGPFATKEELMNALLASSFIPGFFFQSFVPGYPGYVDGGFSHAYGPEPETTIVTTIPRCPVSDISADDNGFHLTFLDFQGYMDIFWLGYDCARRSRELVVTKLKAQGLSHDAAS
jgi:hypothetical protein